MKLVFNEAEIEVGVKTPSLKVKRAFLEHYSKISAIEKQGKLQTYIFSQKNEDGELSEANIQDLIAKGLKNGDFAVNDVLSIETADNMLTDDCTKIEAVKAILQTKHLTTDQKDLFNEPASGEFWSEQSLEEVNTTLNSFRERLGIANY